MQVKVTLNTMILYPQLSILYLVFLFLLFVFKGIRNDHDGYFKCILYSKNNTVLAEKQVEVNVLSKSLFI